MPLICIFLILPLLLCWFLRVCASWGSLQRSGSKREISSCMFHLWRPVSQEHAGKAAEGALPVVFHSAFHSGCVGAASCCSQQCGVCKSHLLRWERQGRARKGGGCCLLFFFFFLKQKRAAPRVEHTRNFHVRPRLHADHDSQDKFLSLTGGSLTWLWSLSLCTHHNVSTKGASSKGQCGSQVPWVPGKIGLWSTTVIRPPF